MFIIYTSTGRGTPNPTFPNISFCPPCWRFSEDVACVQIFICLTILTKWINTLHFFLLQTLLKQESFMQRSHIKERAYCNGEHTHTHYSLLRHIVFDHCCKCFTSVGYRKRLHCRPCFSSMLRSLLHSIWIFLIYHSWVRAAAQLPRVVCLSGSARREGKQGCEFSSERLTVHNYLNVIN